MSASEPQPSVLLQEAGTALNMCNGKSSWPDAKAGAVSVCRGNGWFYLIYFVTVQPLGERCKATLPIVGSLGSGGAKFSQSSNSLLEPIHGICCLFVIKVGTDGTSLGICLSDF